MRFIPKYTVSYRGKFYYPDEEFDIDPADELEMSRHGEVLEESEPPAEEPVEPPEEPVELIEEKPRRGRRRKHDEPGEDETADG